MQIFRGKIMYYIFGLIGVCLIVFVVAVSRETPKPAKTSTITPTALQATQVMVTPTPKMTPLPTPTKPSMQYGMINCTGSVVLRGGPDEVNYERIMLMPAGSRVRVFDAGDEWSRVSYKNGKDNITGYMMTKYLIMLDAEQLLSDAPVSGRVKLADDSTTLRVRRGPGTKYDVVKEAQNGEAIKLYAVNGDWYRIETGANVFGYILSAYVEKTPAITPVGSPQ